MASYEVTGVLKVKQATQVVSDKFSKRELVLTVDPHSQYPQYISMQLTQDKCALLDAYNIGDELKVSFNLRGREWTAPDGVTKYFNSLEAWRIERAGATQPTANSYAPASQEEMISSSEQSDDLPF